ncbi:MAG: DUF533 domain-containing protein [Hyphomicrobiaceae bacterium]|nr:DUF533 domain-containing protein [Hyphomicrobiaceae bacterium]
MSIDAKKLLDSFLGGAATPGAPGQAPAEGAAGPLGNIGGILGQVFGTATEGVRDAAGKVEQKTGVGNALDDILRKATGGPGAGDLLGKAKDLMAQNQLGTGAVLGGLAAVLLGTQTGRGIAGTAAKLGGLALIGGLAYKALQNYQSGRPLLETKRTDAEIGDLTAPAGSGFEEEASNEDTAITCLRAMIAAGMADGSIDETERKRIMGSFSAAGLGDEDAEFLKGEIAEPAQPEDLAEGVQSAEDAAKIYTAARLAIDPDTNEEREFLTRLATALRIEPGLVAHLDAQAASVKV